MKFPYDLPFLPGSSPPERWDVVVFRYPEEPEVSYIKRLVGLPGETLRIHHGDIFIKPPGRRRLPAAAQAAEAPAGHADAASTTTATGPRRWPTGPSGGDGSPRRRRLAGRRTPAQPVSGRGRRRPATGPSCATATSSPTPSSGTRSSNDRPLPRAPRPTLITDFYSYNTNLTSDGSNLIDEPRGEQRDAWLQPHWVGDLTLVGERWRSTSPGGELRFELIEGGVPNRCEIDLATGTAGLYHGDETLARARHAASRDRAATTSSSPTSTTG